MSGDLHKDIADFGAALRGAGRPDYAEQIATAVSAGGTGTEILWAVRYRILRLLALSDHLPVQIVATGRSIVMAIDELSDR